MDCIQVDIFVLASHLAGIGYDVTIRTAIGGGVGKECFRNLSNEFLLVPAPSGSEAKDIVIDPQFRHAVSTITSNLSIPKKMLMLLFVWQKETVWSRQPAVVFRIRRANVPYFRFLSNSSNNQGLKLAPQGQHLSSQKL